MTIKTLGMGIVKLLKTKSKKAYLKEIESNFNDNVMVGVDDFKKLENELSPNNELTSDALYGLGYGKDKKLDKIKSDKSGHDLTGKESSFYIKAGYEAKNKQLEVLTDRAETLVSAIKNFKSKPKYYSGDNLDGFKNKSTEHLEVLSSLEVELLHTISLIENLSSGQSTVIDLLQAAQPSWVQDEPLVKDYITTGKTVTTHDSRQDLYPKLEYIGEDLAKELKLDKNNTQSKGLFILD